MRACHRVDNGQREQRPGSCDFNVSRSYVAAEVRGGVTPFNVIPMHNADSTSSAGAHGHGAGTPLPLCRWWVRYLTRPGGVVLDPFTGTATVGIAALEEGFDFIGIERDAGYVASARERLTRAAAQPLLELKV